jgi:hypothetical protein
MFQQSMLVACYAHLLWCHDKTKQLATLAAIQYDQQLRSLNAFRIEVLHDVEATMHASSAVAAFAGQLQHVRPHPDASSPGAFTSPLSLYIALVLAMNGAGMGSACDVLHQLTVHAPPHTPCV